MARTDSAAKALIRGGSGAGSRVVVSTAAACTVTAEGRLGRTIFGTTIPQLLPDEGSGSGPACTGASASVGRSRLSSVLRFIRLTGIGCRCAQIDDQLTVNWKATPVAVLCKEPLVPRSFDPGGGPPVLPLNSAIASDRFRKLSRLQIWKCKDRPLAPGTLEY